MNLLIVDDESYVREGIERILSTCNLHDLIILKAANGHDALRMAIEHRVDIVISDVRMPQMNGLQLMEALRREEIPCPETIVLTAYDEFDYAKRCIEFGVSRYVLKPIDPQEITMLLSEAFQTVSARRTQHYRWMFPLCCAQKNRRRQF